MPIRFVTGDMFGYPGLEAWSHGCNCAGAMGKGIAVEFRKRFPRMYEAYQLRCRDGRFSLGDVFLWEEPSAPAVFNLATQRTWRTRAELWAIEASVKAMAGIAEDRKMSRIGLPRIGAGLGGLDWIDVRKVLAEVGEATPVEFVVFEGFEPAPKA